MLPDPWSRCTLQVALLGKAERPACNRALCAVCGCYLVVAFIACHACKLAWSLGWSLRLAPARYASMLAGHASFFAHPSSVARRAISARTASAFSWLLAATRRV